MSETDELVSIIIPCYKQSKFLKDSIRSVEKQTYRNIEIVVVDEGGNDNQEIIEAISCSNRELILVETNKLGLANARNRGIENSTGKYILPLDADDKIEKEYVELAVNVLESNNNIGIVYCRAKYFGNRKGFWQLPDYRFPEVLLSPRIFCSAVYRKSDWEIVGGYCDKFIYGWEDHDLWLNIIKLGKDVIRLKEVLFLYRQHENASMTDDLNANREKFIYTVQLLVGRHKKLFKDNLDQIIVEYCNKHTSEYRLLRKL